MNSHTDLGTVHTQSGWVSLFDLKRQKSFHRPGMTEKVQSQSSIHL